MENQYRSGHKKLERKLGYGSGTNYHQPQPQRRLSGGSNGGHGHRGGAGKGCDLAKRYTGASLVKAPKGDGGVTELQKRALDLTGAPLINYNCHDKNSHDKVYRTQSLQSDSHEVTLAQLQQQMIFLRQLQAATHHQQQMHFPRYDVYDSGHGSLDGSSCGGSDHDLRSASAGSAEAETTGSGQCGGQLKRPLEAANSMPILLQTELFGGSGDDVEIEVEDERKYLPTDLFIDQHEKLCSTKSWSGHRWADAEENGRCPSASVQGIAMRKTTSLNPEGFNLFSDQLDLLSSVRSNWNKNSSSCGSSEDGAAAGFEDTAIGSTGFDDTAIGSTGFDDTAMGATGFEDSAMGLTSFEDKQKDFESAMENLTHEMGSILLRKI